MMSEERTRYEVLLENIETNVKLIAEAQGGLSQRLDRMEARFEARFDQLETNVNILAVKVDGLAVKVDGLATKVDRLETKVDRLETKVDGLETKVDGLEIFAADTKGRLTRIEGHLQLHGESSRPKARTEVARRRGRKS